MDFNGNQTVQGPNESFSAASKSFKRHQTMNKGLIWVNNDTNTSKLIRSNHNKARDNPINAFLALIFHCVFSTLLEDLSALHIWNP